MGSRPKRSFVLCDRFIFVLARNAQELSGPWPHSSPTETGFVSSMLSPLSPNHDVSGEEVEEVLENPGEDRPGRDGSRVAIGQTASGRYAVDPLQDPDGNEGSLAQV